ncbi:MAG: TlyA family RNA methyltransferase [Ruminococcaceae bacterium]|nr:TlyA family RNA methyltransferase [Oscillospiraceae bacterium]
MRADVLIFKKGIAKSRENAKKLINDNAVFINGKAVNKPSEDFDENSIITLAESVINKYVSRGGLKLEHALQEFNVDVRGFTALDIGASTGGFTDCLLKHGARKVYAVDVGTAQLDKSLQNDERVVSLEKCNARECIAAVNEKCDIVVMDVSFISQTLLYKTVRFHLKDEGVFISLIKPQFEAGRAHISSGGIVSDRSVHSEIIDRIKKSAFLHGLGMLSVICSPIKGGDGNTEYLAVFKKVN